MKTVVHYTDARDFGGAEKMLLALMEGLDRNRWRPVLVYHPSSAVEQLPLEARAHSIETVPVPLTKRTGPPGLLRALQTRAARVADVTRLARALGAINADVFHAHLPWSRRCTDGFVAAALARIPLRVGTQQLLVAPSERSLRLRQRAISTMVHRYIAVSEAVATALRQSMVPGQKITVVHNAVDIARFDHACGDLVRRELAGGNGRPLVLTLARLNWQKGLEHLMAAAEQLPEVVFAVAGEGSERERLEAEVRRRRLQGRFLLLGQRDDVPQLLAACDLLVLSSLFEGLPISVLEAMAARKPVVATAVPGTVEAVVHNSTGLLVPPSDPAALAAAIGRVVSDIALRLRLAAAGRLRVEQNFSLAAMVRTIEGIYESSTSSERGR